MNSESREYFLIPSELETWEPCVVESSNERFPPNDINCVKSDVHHPHKGGTSNIAGSLSVSEFRLRFTQSGDSKPSILYNEDYLLSFDIPISSIHRITIIPRKKKPKITVTGDQFKVSEDLDCNQIEVLSADFNILKFETFASLPFSKAFVEKLLNFGCRRDVSQLFGVNFGKRVLRERRKSPSDARDDTDWVKRQLQNPPDRIRIFPGGDTKMNVKPELGWTPKCISDDDLNYLASLIEDRRVPVVSCAVPEKGILMRCGKVLKGRRQEFLDRLEKRQRNMSGVTQYNAVEVVKLRRSLPRLEEVTQARRRLRDLCQCYNPESVNSNWLEALDSTQWFSMVSRALSLAVEVAGKLKQEGKWVVLTESNANDWSCVIASLVNIILFPRFRRRAALETLVVREWCLPRHAFSSRLEVAAWTEDERPGPLFALFLDCVQQIWKQFSSEFDFASDLLAVLHDASHAGLFREFLYHLDWKEAFAAPSAFAWERLLSRDGMELMENPMWGLAREMGEAPLEELAVDAQLPHMRLWREHYMRALTFMDMGQAGRAARMWRLREILAEMRARPEVDGVTRRQKNSFELKLPSGRSFADISAFFPLSHEASIVDTSRVSCLPVRPHSVNDLLD